MTLRGNSGGSLGRALLLYSSTLLIACGSLRGRTRHISVDSEPRGLTLYDQEGELIGETPLFHRVESGAEIVLNLAGGETPAPQRFSCQFQWLQTPLENLPLPLVLSPAGAPIALGVYGASLLTDTLSGAAYRCPERVIVTPGAPAHHAHRSCPRYLRVDFTSLPQQQLTQLTERWWSEGAAEASRADTSRPSTSRDPACPLQLLEDQDAWSHRLSLSLDELSASNLEAWREDRSRVNRLGFETQASHLLQLAFTPARAGEPPQVKVTELDLHTLESTETLIPSPREVIEETEGVRYSLRTLLRAASTLIPDTLGVSFMLRDFKAIDRTRAERDVRRSSQSVALTHVSHPDAFRDWDYELRLSFGLNLDLEQGFESSDSELPAIIFNRYAANAIATLTGHTPLGAFGVHVGPGIGLYQFSESRLSEETYIAGEVHSGIHYTFFLTERIMGRFEVNNTEVGDTIGAQLFPRFADAAFTIGYYVPTLQRLPRALME